MASDVLPVERVDVHAFTVPTEEPESDGTLEWDATSVVVVELHAAGRVGLGFTYAHPAAAVLIHDLLTEVVRDEDALAIEARWKDMHWSVRNVGRKGLASYAIAAVDIALWDLKARFVDVSVATLLGRARDHVPIYASGGFTSSATGALCAQLAGWVEAGIPRVKMKVGRDLGKDRLRVAAVRDAIGPEPELYVDANGACSRQQALALAEDLADYDVTWFEEPVSSDDLRGLQLLRDRSPAGMDVAAGEYATVPMEFRELLVGGAVDCLQADVTRCGGFTGFTKAAALSAAFEIDVSSHTAPHLSAYACQAIGRLRHLEWFYDHVRLERMLFDGILEPRGGRLTPDRTRPGLGLELKRSDAERYAA